MEPEMYRQMAQDQQSHWWFVARRQVLGAILDSLSLPADARILEVGCGTGGNLGMLSRYGRVSAIESDPYARTHASELSGLTVRDGSLPDGLPDFGHEFDLICLFDVLEHVEADTAALAALSRRLVPGGRLLISVPAYQWLFGGHDRAHHHFRRYTVTELRTKAARAGLTVVRSGYFNTVLFPLVLVRRVLGRLAGGQGDDAAMPAPMVNRILRALFSVESRVVARRLFPFGTSALALLRRAS
ncbi:MAG: hypothetical protein AMXMBFR6_16920 [Betaproteobacteria bacterium]